MENEVPADVSVPLLTVIHAQDFVYSAAINLSDEIYSWRKLGRGVPEHILDGLEKAKRVHCDLGRAAWGRTCPSTDAFFNQLQEIEEIGLDEFFRLRKASR